MNVIIGGGISGLSFALFSKKKSLIIEKEDELGGYCRSINQDGFIWDFSGHFFHFRNKKIKKIMLSKIGCKVLDIKKKSTIFYNNKFIEFPFQKNIHQLNKKEFIECLIGLFSKHKKQKTKNFKDFIIDNYGEAICKKFLIPYNEKLYATNLNKLEWHAMGRFFPSIRKDEIIKGFKKKNFTSYNDYFTYPKNGAVSYVKSLQRQIKNAEYKLNTSVVKIEIKKKIIHLDNGEIIPYDNLISSIPFPNLLQKCNISYNKNIFSANKVCVFNLGFDKKSFHKDHWIYFPSKKISFYRVGFYNNIFKNNRMSLYVEIGKSSKYIVNKEKLFKKVIADLKSVGIISNQKVISKHYLEMNPAYVHITNTSEKHKKNLKKKLEKNKIYSIGRYGDWKYCSIEDNIVEALNLNNIIRK